MIIISKDCVDIISTSADPTRNFFRVRFRNPKLFVGGKYSTPQWGQKAAMTIGTKYYGVKGCKITMAQPVGGRWMIQNVLIPKNGGVEMTEELALQIANHIQDRIEREGQWTAVMCRDNETKRYISKINGRHIERDERGRFAPHAAEEFGAEWRGRWDVGNERYDGQYEEFRYYIRKVGNNPQRFEVYIRGNNPEGRELIRQASKNPIFRNLRHPHGIKIGFFIQHEVMWEGQIIKGLYQVSLPKLVEEKRRKLLGNQVFRMTAGNMIMNNYGEPVIEGLYRTKQEAVDAIYYYFEEMEYPFHISNWPLDMESWSAKYGAEEFGVEEENCPKCSSDNIGKEEMPYCYTCGRDIRNPHDECYQCGSDNMGEEEMDYCYNCGEQGFWFDFGAEEFGAEAHTDRLERLRREIEKAQTELEKVEYCNHQEWNSVNGWVDENPFSLTIECPQCGSHGVAEWDEPTAISWDKTHLAEEFGAGNYYDPMMQSRIDNNNCKHSYDDGEDAWIMKYSELMGVEDGLSYIEAGVKCEICGQERIGSWAVNEKEGFQITKGEEGRMPRMYGFYAAEEFGAEALVIPDGDSVPHHILYRLDREDIKYRFIEGDYGAEEFGAESFEAKLNPTVLALRMWLIHDKSSPFQLAKARYGRNRTSLVNYIPKGDYKITQVEKISYDIWGDAEKKVYRMSYKSPKGERGEWLNIGDTISYAGLTTLHYDTNVSWDVPTFKYKSYPYERDSHGSVIYNYLWANNKYSSHAYRRNTGIHSSPMPIKEMNDYWEIVSPPSKFISWYSKPANQKIVKDAFAKKEKAEEDRKMKYDAHKAREELGAEEFGAEQTQYDVKKGKNGIDYESANYISLHDTFAEAEAVAKRERKNLNDDEVIFIVEESFDDETFALDTNLLLSMGKSQTKETSSDSSFDAEEFEAQQFYNSCSTNQFEIFGRNLFYKCSSLGSVRDSTIASFSDGGLGTYNGGKYALRLTGGMKKYAIMNTLAEVSQDMQPSSMEDWKEVVSATNQIISATKAQRRMKS